MTNPGNGSTPSHIDRRSDLYRPCVAMMVINAEKKIFMAQRLDGLNETWQVPQGGLDPHEDEAHGALRELYEETGITSVQILATSSTHYFYDLPLSLQGKVWNGAFKGQKQRWFLMVFTGHEDEISLVHQGGSALPEFKHWCWMPPHLMVSNVVDFKRDVYQQAYQEFAPIIASFSF